MTGRASEFTLNSPTAEEETSTFLQNRFTLGGGGGGVDMRKSQ